MDVKKKTPVGARYGLNDWLAQRVTALVLVVCCAVLFVALLVARPADYEAWRAFVLSGWVRVTLLLVVLAIVKHAFIGARDIFMDYIKHDFLRLCKTMGCAVYLFICLLWAAKILI